MLGSQAIRLGGNLILTRLLFPEAFGLIAVAMAVITGIAMLSDVGIRSSVIKSKRSGETEFMETVWTLQALRGVILTVAICLAAFPAAAFYEEPLLLWMLPILSIDILFRNLKSVSLYIYDKNLDLKRQVMLDLGSQVVGLTIMVVWAAIHPSIWALVAGTLFNSGVQLVSSYLLFKGNYSRLRWDWLAVKEILHFGVWIFLSTAVGFISNQGDRLIMGAWMEMSEVGVYAIAAILASAVNMVIIHVSFRILQPLYRQKIDGDQEHRIFKIRNQLNLLCTGACVALALVAEFVVELLYDIRYVEAGWMAALLAVRGIGFCLYSTLQAYLLSSGNSFGLMKYQLVHTSYIIIGMTIGAQYGTIGILMAYASSTIICYPMLAAQVGFKKFNGFRYDVLLVLGGLSACVLGWYLTDARVLDLILMFFSLTI